MLIPILVFTVLAIALIFFLIKSAETWNWIPITFVALIFLTSIFGGIAISRSWKVRAAWMDRYNQNETQLAKTRAEFEEAVYGSPDSVDGYGAGSLREVSARLNLAQIGKGRIWPGGTPARQGEQFTLTFSPAAGVPSPASQINQDMQLYAFADGGATIGDVMVSVPVELVGSFKVLSVDAGSHTVTIEPVFLTKAWRTGSLMRALVSELGSGAATTGNTVRDLAVELESDARSEFEGLWTTVVEGGASDGLVTWLNDKASAFEPGQNWSLFEKMPGDRRMAFKDHMGMAEFTEQNPATPELLAEYRAALQSTYLPAAMMQMDPASVEYEELLDEYTFDSVPLNVVNQYLSQNSNTRINDRFDPSDENKWGKIVFNANSEEFTVDQNGNFVTDGTFTFTGTAIAKELHLGKTVSFKKDDELVVPYGWIEGFKFGNNDDQPGLIETNDASFTEIEYFRRSVRDYPFQLREFRNLMRRTAEQQQALVSDLKITDGMIEDSRDQISHRDEVEINLRADIQRMERDVQTINQLHDQRDVELNLKREQIRTYYNQIIELYKQSESNGDALNTHHAPPSDQSLAARR